MRPNLTATEAVTKRAADLAVGDEVMGDLLPLGVPGEVIYHRLFERNRSEWMFVAYVQRDGFHDSTTFLADAPIRVRAAEQPRVADPTGLAYSRADDEPDDPTPVSGARVPMHSGGMTDEGLVDETYRPGLIVGDTAEEQMSHAYAAYERDEAEYLDLPRCPNCHGRHDVADGCH